MKFSLKKCAIDADIQSALEQYHVRRFVVVTEINQKADAQNIGIGFACY